MNSPVSNHTRNFRERRPVMGERLDLGEGERVPEGNVGVPEDNLPQGAVGPVVEGQNVQNIQNILLTPPGVPPAPLVRFQPFQQQNQVRNDQLPSDMLPAHSALRPDRPLVDTPSDPNLNVVLSRLMQKIENLELAVHSNPQTNQAIKMEQPMLSQISSQAVAVPNNLGPYPQESSKPTYQNTRRFHELPTFDGTKYSPHPKDFLNEVEDFFEQFCVSDEVKLKEVGRLLRDDARSWYQVYRVSFRSFTDFKSAFLEFYWGPQMQNSARLSLLAPGRSPPGHGQLAPYFLHQLRAMNYLDDTPSDSFKIASIIQSFPYDVKLAITQFNATNIDAVLQILKSFDHLGPRPSSDLQVVPFQNQQVQNVNNNSRANPRVNFLSIEHAPGADHGEQPQILDSASAAPQPGYQPLN